MKFVRSTLGYMIAGLIVIGGWGQVLNGEIGLLGGILAGAVMIGMLWSLNHHLGLIPHGADSAFVDLGLGVGMTGIFQGMWSDILTNGNINSLVAAIPTIIVVVIGACAGGYCAALIEGDMEKDGGIK